jgi:membrane peptidoglycan carboxypeptidase
MKVGLNSNEKRQNFSIKHHLLNLHDSLEEVIFKIDEKYYDRIAYNHSHTIHLAELTKLQQAILFLEDRRFFYHRGFEFKALARAAKRFALGKRAGAVSTLDQQLVRICTGRYERTLRRKLRETLLAFLLNSHRSKAEIFYTYLHNSYFGYKLEGCEITAKFLFSKPATNLSYDEAAFIASLLTRPLPKTVFLAIELVGKQEKITPEFLIQIGRSSGLEWADRIEERYQYVRRMSPSIPSSLRTR